MTLPEAATHLQELAHSPNIIDAVDLYYHPDVTVVEGDGRTFHGAETQKSRILEFFGTLQSAPIGGVRALAIHETEPGNGVVFVETSDALVLADGTHMTFDQVAVQRWENGRVVHERFYHNPPTGA